jgi:hypothetical protein
LLAERLTVGLTGEAGEYVAYDPWAAMVEARIVRSDLARKLCSESGKASQSLFDKKVGCPHATRDMVPDEIDACSPHRALAIVHP